MGCKWVDISRDRITSDIEISDGFIYALISIVLSEGLSWRSLCHFGFTQLQINQAELMVSNK